MNDGGIMENKPNKIVETKIGNTDKSQLKNDNMIICEQSYTEARHENKSTNKTTGRNPLNTNEKQQQNEWIVAYGSEESNKENKTPKYKDIMKMCQTLKM